MKILSLNVGTPIELSYKNKPVSTSIIKRPITGPVKVSKLNIEGDKQADLKVHGGEHKAVYSYSSLHYPWWKEQLPNIELSWGSFGENLVISDMDENDFYIGDLLQINDCVLEVAQARQPCFKLEVKFNDKSIVKKFLDSKRWGIYYRVKEEGTISVGDKITRIHTHPAKITVYELPELATGRINNKEKVSQLLNISTLCPKIRAKLLKLQST